MNNMSKVWMLLVLALSISACEGWIQVAEPDEADDVKVEADEPSLDPTAEKPTVIVDDTPVELAPGRMQRLTTVQYQNSVRAVFGEQITFDGELELDEHSELFMSIGASKVGTSSRGVELYQDSALAIARQVFEQKDEYEILADCAPEVADDPCVEEVVRHYGRLLWRRALTDDEVDRFTSIVGAAGTEPEELSMGLVYVMAGLLASPNFIYVPNLGEVQETTEVRRYTQYEMASRLAFFIWNAPPDDALLRAAENGELHTTEGIRAATERMLQDPRARSLATRFFAEHWNVDDLTVGLHPRDSFAEWNEDLAEAYKTEFDLVLQDIAFDRDADLFEVFTGERTFVNREVAEVYGASLDSDGWVEMQLDPTRSGLLTSGAVIAANSTSENFLPTYRGVFVMERILCQTPPAPPPEVEEELEEAVRNAADDDTPRTTREIVEEHASDPKCAGCHASFDPMGFTYENFDRIGRYQTEQNGRPVDAVGDVFGTELVGVPALGDWLIEEKHVSRCMTKRLYSFAIGRRVLDGEEGLVDQLDHRFVEGGRSFQDLVLSIVTSPGFRFLSDRPTDGQGME